LLAMVTRLSSKKRDNVIDELELPVYNNFWYTYTYSTTKSIGHR